MPLSSYDRDHIDDIMAGEGTWFTAQLLRLIRHADCENRARLARGFPKEVALVKAWERGEIPLQKQMPGPWEDRP